MSKQASTLLTNVLSRIRDPNATGIATNTPPTTASGQTFGYAQLTQAQYFINAATEAVLSTATLALTAGTTLYPVFSNFANAIRLRTVQNYNHADLYKSNWRSFGRANRRWMTEVGYPRSWAPIGHDILAIVPATNTLINAQMGSVTVQYVKLTAAVSTGTDTFDLPDDQLGLVETLTELFCRLKTRQLGKPFQDSLERLTSQIATEKKLDINLDKSGAY